MIKSSCALVTRTVLGTIVALGAFVVGSRDAAAEPAEEQVVAGCTSDDDCDALETCRTPVKDGPSSCECLPGYRAGAGGCNDVDECTEGSDSCGADATCVNRIGTFTCACNPGFTGDGVICTNVDECQIGEICWSNSHCFDEPGTYRCECDPGYESDGESCLAIDPSTTASTGSGQGGGNGGEGGGDGGGTGEGGEGGQGTSDAGPDLEMGHASVSKASGTRSFGPLRQAGAELAPVAAGDAAVAGLDTDDDDLDIADDDDAKASGDAVPLVAGLLCSASPAGGADPSAIATLVAAVGVLVSRRRKS